MRNVLVLPSKTDTHKNKRTKIKLRVINSLSARICDDSIRIVNEIHMDARNCKGLKKLVVVALNAAFHVYILRFSNIIKY